MLSFSPALDSGTGESIGANRIVDPAPGIHTPCITSVLAAWGPGNPFALDLLVDLGPFVGAMVARSKFFSRLLRSTFLGLCHLAAT